MNARRKQRQRHWQYKDAEDDAIAKEMNDLKPLLFAHSKFTCKRCEKPFVPKWVVSLRMWATCCGDCMMRNFFDRCDLPTPPGLLDRFTKLPTLTDMEWREKI